MCFKSYCFGLRLYLLVQCFTFIFVVLVSIFGILSQILFCAIVEDLRADHLAQKVGSCLWYCASIPSCLSLDFGLLGQPLQLLWNSHLCCFQVFCICPYGFSCLFLGPGIYLKCLLWKYLMFCKGENVFQCSCHFSFPRPVCLLKSSRGQTEESLVSQCFSF